MASLHAYQLLSQTLLQCIDLTLHTVSSTGSAHCAVAVSTPALYAVLHTSYAIRWLGAWILPSAASVPARMNSEVSLSSDIGDMAQLAADMSASDAAQNRVELFLGAVTRRAADVPGAPSPRFRAEAGEHTHWFPSATYPVAVHTVLVHVLCRLVHVSVPDAYVKILPFEEEGGARLELHFVSSIAGELGTWPQWLGPQADLQGLLDGFGIAIAQSMRGPTTVVSVQLHRPQSVDLLSNLPVHEQHLPSSPIQELPMADFQRQLAGRSVHVIPSAREHDLLAEQVAAFAASWGCTPAADAAADYVVVHENLEALRDALAAAPRGTRFIYLAHLAHLAHLDGAVSSLGTAARLAHVALVPTPVSSLRLLWAMYMAGIPGTGGLFVSELHMRNATHASSVAMRRRDAPPTTAEDPLAAQRFTSTWAQQGPHMLPQSPRTTAATPPLLPETVSYFSAAVSRLSDRTHASAGLVIRDEDGRAVGIFFKPGAEDPTASVSPRSSVPSLAASPELDARGLAIQMDTSPAPDGARASLSAEPAELLLGQHDAAGSALFPSGHVIKPTGFSSLLRSPEGTRSPSDSAVQAAAAAAATGRRTPRPRATAPPELASISAVAATATMSHLPARLRRTSAQPQAGLLIGGSGGGGGGGSGAPAPTPAHISGIQRRNKALREFVLPPIKVLIVEDNVINQRILATFLRQKKIQYQVASDGREAIDKWRVGDFHLILMDIQLPVLDGIEATKEIRRLEGEMNAPQNAQSPLSPARPSVIIVALTASVLVSDRVAALAAGCNDFLNKPVSLPWLQRKILEWGSMQYLLHAGSAYSTAPGTHRSFKLASDAHANVVASSLRLHRPAE